MKFVRTLLATTAPMTFFALSLPSFAQEQNQERDRTKAPPASITGCLTKAETGDQSVPIDNQSGAKMVVTGANFDRHANHTVTVTGAPSEDGKTFTVATIQHVADSCPVK